MELTIEHLVEAGILEEKEKMVILLKLQKIVIREREKITTFVSYSPKKLSSSVIPKVHSADH